jgi:DNA-binding SARP family transcriptional activator
MFELQLLGPLALRRDGQLLALGTQKVQALLLLLGLGGPAHRARLAEWLWPELDDAAARRNLRRELARLREAGADGLLRAEGDVLALADGVDCDAAHFEAEATTAPDRALARWRGPPADGLRIDASHALAEWLDAERQRLQALRRRALRASFDAHADDPERALERVQALLADDPLQEQLHAEAMRLLAQLGRREAVLAQYERCRTLLAQELGLAPMAQTEALADSLRKGRAAAPPPPPATQASWPLELTLVGREADEAWLAQAWADGSTVLLEGEAGIGKTRLAQDAAAAQGAYALSQCRSTDADAPYSSFVRALRLLAGQPLASAGLPDWMTAELAHVLPELGPAAHRVAGAEELSRLHQAALAAWTELAGESFDVVVIDDWHLADPASRGLFTHLALQRGSVRMWLLLRPDLADAAHAALNTLRTKAGAWYRRLEPLDDAALRALLRQWPAAAQPDAVVARLRQATGGNPFFAVETLRHWQAEGLLDKPVDPSWPLPPTLRATVLARVQRLPQATQRVLDAAALATEPFAPALLASACALSEVEALAAIEPALSAQLLRETGGAYAFAHDLVQWSLEAALPPARRRLVHRRLALGGDTAGLPPAEVARHWEQGGEPARAVAPRLAAAQAALMLGSEDVARAHWQAALANGPSPDEHVELVEQRSGLERRLDDRPAMLDSVVELDRLRAIWSQNPVTAMPALRAAILAAQVLSLSANSAESLRRIDDVLPALDSGHPLQALALLVRSQALNGVGRTDESRADAEAALALEGLSPGRRAQLHYSLVYSHFLRGNPQPAMHHAQLSLQLWRATGARRSVVLALSNIGMLHAQLGDQQKAIAVMQEGLATARALRMIEQHRMLAINLADSLLTLGLANEVLPLVQEALDLSPNYSSLRSEVFLLGARVQALYQRGELLAAQREARKALERALAINDPMALLDCASMALEPVLAAGDEALADRLLASTAGVRTESLEHYTHKLAFNRVRRELARGDLPGARAELAPVADIESLHEARDRQHAAVCQAELLLAEGDAEAALGLLGRWPMDGAHVEVGARAEAVHWQAERALGLPGTQALAALRARLAAATTPVPVRSLLQALIG